MPKFSHTRGEAVRSHPSKRAIQDSDAALTQANRAQTVAELTKALAVPDKPKTDKS